MQRGLIFNIQKYSLHDGPGIRTTVFLKGCPLRCVWCHNPESMARQPELVVVENRCLACACCRDACPNGNTIGGEGALPTRNEACGFCGECVETCPTGARQWVGREMSVTEVMEAVLKDRVFYETSHGGVTFSGGEPLCQPEFLRSALALSREHGLHSAVDTSGFVRQEDLLSLASMVDLFLYDLKLFDDTRHRQFTGVSNAVILDNLQALGCIHRQIWLRIPIIPGMTDGDADLEAAARFATTIPAITQVNLLPYHKTGVVKSQRLGRENQLEGMGAPSAESMERCVAIFQRHGLTVKTGG